MDLVSSTDLVFCPVSGDPLLDIIAAIDVQAADEQQVMVAYGVAVACVAVAIVQAVAHQSAVKP